MSTLEVMTTSASTLLRVSALLIAAGLGLSACTSDDSTVETPDSGGDLETLEAPDTTPQETGLVEALEAEFDVTQTATLAQQWPDITAMVSALGGTEDPDLCQQAGLAQYRLLAEAQPAGVRGVIDHEALLDDHASGETVTVFYAADDASPEQLQAAYEHTDVSCVEEYETAITHDTEQDEVAGQQATVHTWEVVASKQLTGRMIDVVSDELFVRYAAAYPPQVIADQLEGDVAESFNTAATQRALAIFEAAAAQ